MKRLGVVLQTVDKATTEEMERDDGEPLSICAWFVTLASRLCKPRNCRRMAWQRGFNLKTIIKDGVRSDDLPLVDAHCYGDKTIE